MLRQPLVRRVPTQQLRQQGQGLSSQGHGTVLQPPAEGVFREASSPRKCLLRSSASLWSLNGSRHTKLVVPSNPQIFFPGAHVKPNPTCPSFLVLRH